MESDSSLQSLFKKKVISTLHSDIDLSKSDIACFYSHMRVVFGKLKVDLGKKKFDQQENYCKLIEDKGILKTDEGPSSMRAPGDVIMELEVREGAFDASFRAAMEKSGFQYAST